MKKMLSLVIVLGALGGCSKKEYSTEKTEPAIVEDTIFMPSQHGSGTGLSTKGSVVFSSVDIPEKYAVVFKCEHGKFVIEGSKKKHKEMWGRLQKGQSVTIHYREEYRVTETEKTLSGYDFIKAE